MKEVLDVGAANSIRFINSSEIYMLPNLMKKDPRKDICVTGLLSTREIGVLEFLEEGKKQTNCFFAETF